MPSIATAKVVKPGERPEDGRVGNGSSVINPGRLELSPVQDRELILNPMYEIVGILASVTGPFAPSFKPGRPYMDRGLAPGLID